MISKIDSSHPLNKPSKTEQKKAIKKAGDSAFDSMLDAAGEAEEVKKASPVMPTSPIGTMLALQEIGGDEFARKKAVKQGSMSLDALEHIRDALLTGELTTQHITHLQHVVDQQRDLIDDPALNAVLDDIELRVAVELAKLEKARRA